MIRTATGLFLALTLAGCGQSGSEYLGTWTRKQVEQKRNYLYGGVTTTKQIINDTLTIDRNGETFMIHSSRVFQYGDEKPTTFPERKEPGTFKDGQIQVAGGLAAYVIDKSTGHLVPWDHQGDYIRSK